jgi:hypothetical protein
MRKLFLPMLFLGVKFISHMKGTTLIKDFIGQYSCTPVLLYFVRYIQNRGRVA